MRNRRHRVDREESHDDWKNGSWTVDCICGVTDDDGQEMVDCDECGVWVHTRCSRYVKSDKSFFCHNCKGKNSKDAEAAQALPGSPFTEISTEKSVHVHGVPGGDPSLFVGLSSVFSPQLWKATGYVPKKFNSQYKEFPSWDEKEPDRVDRRNHEDTDNAAKNQYTAGVLFSFLKDKASVNLLGSSEGVNCLVEDGTAGKGENLEHIKSSGENMESRLAVNVGGKDSSLPQAAVVGPLKHKKKERGTSNDRRERKRTGIHEKGIEFKKRARITSTTASSISSDGKQFEFYEDRGRKVIKVYTESCKSGDPKQSSPEEHLSNCPGIKGINKNNDQKHASADEHDVETNRFDSSRCCTNSDGRLKEDDTGDLRESKIENSHKVKEAYSMHPSQVVSGTVDSSNVNGGGLAQRISAEFQKLQPVVEHFAVASQEVKDSKNTQGLIGDVALSSVPNSKVKTDVDNNLDVLNDHQSPSSEENLEEISDQMQDEDKSTADDDYKKDDIWPGGCQSKPELPTRSGVWDGSSGLKSGSTGSDCSLGGRKSSSQLQTDSKYVDGVCKLVPRTSSSDPNHLKVLVSKSSSETYKPSTSGSHSSRNVPSLSSSSKQRGMLNDNLGSRRRDAGSSDEVKEEGRIEKSKKITKDIPKFSNSPVSKVSQSSKLSHGSVPKGTSSHPKESSLRSSRKALAPSVTTVPGFGDSTYSLKTRGASNAHNKDVGSGLLKKSEKANQPDSQYSSNVDASQMQHPASTNYPSRLSDEDIALLLHHELNSSPRVPRTRHGGSFPHLTSPTGASMLTKRISSSGGKDFSSSSRRKWKESGKDGALSARDVFDEAKKLERVSPSLDHRGQDSVISTNPFTKGDVESGLQKYLVRKNKPPALTATTNSGLSSSTEVNDYKVSSTRNSPRYTSDGDSGAVGRPRRLTLPGLIAKIMNKGEHMTLEELCNTVLPHWPHLRKHNGEPYGYSSHSDAVLDCLRSRYEWAHLVDHGPKTSTSRKRRNPYADPSGTESEDSVRRERISKDGTSKGLESHQEVFPKGKRKARKRRILGLHGRGFNEFKRRCRVEVSSDDEDGSHSNSSRDRKFSEDEMQGDGTSGTNEASASSDETGK